MTIFGSTRVFLILGDPVAQVRAPQVFNHLFEKHGVDAVLVPARVAPGEFDSFAHAVLKAGNIDGLWLTIPHKTAMMRMLDRCDALGHAAGAVNAARRNADGSIEGALFDGIGFAKGLDHWKVPIAGRRVLIVGAGGAGVAIAATLAARGAARIALAVRDVQRATEIVERLRAAFNCDVAAVPTPDPAGYDLVINATPLGMQASDPLAFDVARLDDGSCVVDILMKNQPTPLLRACHARGIAAYPGFEMLIQQVPEYLSFFGLDHVAAAVQSDLSGVRALFEAAQ
ncbi:saccharopine dehydrogenase NADP-binding domain-containing protein [Variovorax humicola]|uniref:shikimate dehydrogenase (NADP(+)) n=1 Tax=Variovorax humicola TaxID=1769758 RepID=A0ABU8W972_9BURK